MSHHTHHQAQHWNAWRSLILIWTAVLGVLLNRVTPLGIIGALLAGFVVAATVTWVAYLFVHRDRSC